MNSIPPANSSTPSPSPTVTETHSNGATKEPAGPQSVSISMDQVSTELGVPRGRLEQQTKILAKFLESRHTPKGLCTDEDDDSTEKLCGIIENLTNNRVSSHSRRETGRRVPIRPHHFAQQQGMGYGRLMRSINREPVNRVMVWSARMLATTSCPRNLSAAAIRRLEAGLPTPSVRFMMEKLYDHAAACLRPQDEGYEITHLRQGLLRMQWGNKAGAKAALERAAQAEDSTDRPRVLYWAGSLQTNPSLRKKFWDKLVDEYPLSFHALEVWKHRRQDPLEIFEARPALTLSRHSDNEDVDNAVRWLEALYVQGHTEAGQKLARWLNSTFKDDLAPSQALYISALKSGRANPLNSMTFLTQQVNENPTMINRQTLRLLFPRPYYDVFDRHSPETDTSLVLAVARQESGFNPRARSPANAQGLLQLLPSTARRLSGKRRNNLYDSEINAQLGVKYLSSLISQFDGRVELALAGYNAGPGRIGDWTSRFDSNNSTLFMDLIPFKETRHYVANILRNNYWYERIYASENAAGRSLASLKAHKQQKSEIVSQLVEAHENARMRTAKVDAPDTQ
ncbi:MAG: lytic transglycosylase domain-containing protein [Bdellovibrionales bacterium]|nr:lytic transglycosylase domain-containing protein [Bdellovibrionales bacterium]